MRKGDIFVYPRALDPYKKYYVEEVYQNQMGERMVIASWEELEIDTGWDRTCQPLNNLLYKIKTGHIKIIGNENHIIHKSIKKHCFNPTPRNMPWISNWKRINPYEDSHLFNWGLDLF